MVRKIGLQSKKQVGEGFSITKSNLWRKFINWLELSSKIESNVCLTCIFKNYISDSHFP